jgi:hypothetical protein
MLAPKLPQMTIAQVVRAAVRSTLRQLTEDFEMDFKELKRSYLEDGADFYEVSAPVGWGAAGAPVTKVPEASKAIVPAKAPASSAPTSLSKMKKEDLIRVCQDMGLDIEGTVPELRTRIKDAGGLPTGSGAAGPGTIVKSSSSKSKSSKPKVPALPAPELTEESMGTEIVPAKKSSKSEGSSTKTKKKKTLEKPVHTHPIGEDGEASECQVCETYGNPLVKDPEEPEESEYVEETKSLRERLNLLLATEMNQDDDEVEEVEEDLDQQETQLVEE